MTDTATYKVGDRVRIKDDIAALYGIPAGTEGTIRSVGVEEWFGEAQKALAEVAPLDVEWDGEDYSGFWYQLGPHSVYDRVKIEEVEAVE
jgi:hypothetical protein